MFVSCTRRTKRTGSITTHVIRPQEFQGYVELLGQDWSSALDRLALDRGTTVPLAKDDVFVDR
jgi:hypothetical protein